MQAHASASCQDPELQPALHKGYCQTPVSNWTPVTQSLADGIIINLIMNSNSPASSASNKRGLTINLLGISTQPQTVVGKIRPTSTVYSFCSYVHGGGSCPSVFHEGGASQWELVLLNSLTAWSNYLRPMEYIDGLNVGNPPVPLIFSLIGLPILLSRRKHSTE